MITFTAEDAKVLYLTERTESQSFSACNSSRPSSLCTLMTDWMVLLRGAFCCLHFFLYRPLPFDVVQGRSRWAEQNDFAFEFEEYS
jgi:hypothetical protein